MGFYSFVKRKKLGVITKKMRFKDLTTIKVGGKIQYFYCPNDTNSLIKAMRYIHRKKLAFFILGNGSNIIASDKKFKKIVISLKKMPEKMDVKDGIVTVSANYMAGRLTNNLARYGYKNLEFISGIPGTIGGIIAMNAGCFGFEIKDYIESCLVMDETGRIRRLTKEELELRYRNSVIKESNMICLEANFYVNKTEENLFKIIEEFKNKKIEAQPTDKPSAGSIFKNPKHYHAFELISHANLMGKRIGNAMISTKHGNFIINLGNAKSSDVKGLILYIKNIIYERFKINLETEVIIL